MSLQVEPHHYYQGEGGLIKKNHGPLGFVVNSFQVGFIKRNIIQIRNHIMWD